MTRRQTDTSAAAYGSIVDASERLRAVVYRTLHAHPAGLTVDETCAIAKYPRYSLQPRFTELRDRKAIFDTGLRRRNVSGAKAIVWRITEQQEMGAMTSEMAQRAMETPTTAALTNPSVNGGAK